MNKKWRKSIRLAIASFFGSLFLCLTLANSGSAHWADLSVAEVVLSEKEAQVTLTFPTGLAAFADENRDKQLSAQEIRSHRAELEKFLSDRIRLVNGNLAGKLALQPLETAAIPATAVQASTHSTLLLSYTWENPVRDLQIHYDLFLPGVNTASCQATILQAGQVQTFVFTPTNKEFSLSGKQSPWSSFRNAIIAIAGSFAWGAMHALSPGHGKTIVAAYLVGSRATVKHALFLALTTTISHTAGVFALGLVTLFAAHSFLPDRLYPWLGVLSGLTIVAIGLQVSASRLRQALSLRRAAREQEKTSAVELLKRGTWTREFSVESGDRHHHHHHHHHHHPHGEHSHLPPGAEGEPVTWQSLLALGISGGLLPCPSALVVLLSAWSLGSPGFGIGLVVAFSLGLAGILTAIGLLLIYAKRIYERLPKQVGVLPSLSAASAAIVVLLGCGIVARSLLQIITP